MTTSTDRRAAAARTAPLTRLLQHRQVLGRTWIERTVHGLPGTGQLLVELTELEALIAERCPAVADRWVRQWILADATLIHDPDQGPRPGCQYCQADATTVATA